MEKQEKFMQRCLTLAIKGLGNVAPNPMVGCVITYGDKVIGEGYHQKYGEAHAEVNAIASVQDKTLLEQSTLYVSMEPCSHFGKTPPCADLIVRSKIPRVVIASNDPNPLVAGKGIERLKNAGIEVITGVLKNEADFLNRRFLTFHSKRRPYIILKWAQGSDGFMALNEPQQFWLTNNESKKLSHKWRTEEPAILVGKNTVIIDDCELTARLWPGKNPLRIVIDRKTELDKSMKIFNRKANTLVFNEVKDTAEDNIRFVQIDFNGNVILQITEALYEMDIQSVTIEGGAETLNHFITSNTWDEARVFTTPHLLKNGKPAPQFSEKLIEEIKIEQDTLKIYTNPAL